MVAFKVKLKCILKQITFVDNIFLFLSIVSVPKGLDCDYWMMWWTHKVLSLLKKSLQVEAALLVV